MDIEYEVDEHRQENTAMSAVNRALYVLSAANEAMLRMSNEPELLQEICSLVVQKGGYYAAWVGYLNDDGQSLRPVAIAERNPGFFDSIKFGSVDGNHVDGNLECPASQTAHCTEFTIVHNLSANPSCRSCSICNMIQPNFQSVFCYPLSDTDKTFGVLTIYAMEANAFTTEEEDLLTRLSRNLAYGINTLRTRQEYERSQASIIQSEKELNSILQNMQDTYCRLDLAGNILRISPSVTGLLGYTPEELLGTPMEDLYLEPDARDKYLKVLFESGGNLRAHEAPLRHKNGSIVWVATNAQYILNEQDKVIAIDGTIRDVTKRKLAEQALRESENKFRSLAEKSLVGVYIIQDGLFQYVNPRYTEMIGYSADELIGKLGPRDTTYADDWPIVEENIRKRMSGEATSVNYIIRGVTKSGKLIYVELFGNSTELNGKPAIVGTIMDITERLREQQALADSEEHFRALFENAAMGIVRAAPDFRITDANKTFLDFVGYEREDVIGKTYTDFMHPDEATQSNSILEKISAGEQFATVEKRYRHKDGSDVWANVGVSAIRDIDGHITAWITTHADITERKRYEQELLSLAESSPDSIIRYDKEGRILYLNQKLYHDLGITEADVIGKTIREAWPDNRFFEIEQAVEQAIESGEAVSVELVHSADSGESVHSEIRIVAERDATGRIIGALGFGRDITTIREAEHRLSHFLESLPGLAYVFRLSPDGHGSFPFASSGITEIYGLMPEDVKADMAPIHDLAHPDDRPRIEAAIAESAQTMTPLRIELRVCRPGLPERWIVVRSVPEKQPDGAIHWYGIMLDITERKQAEDALNQFKTTLDMTKDCVFMFSPESLQFFYANQGAAEHVGYTVDEMTKMTPLDIKPEFDESRFRNLITPMLEGRKTSITFETVHRHKNGAHIPVEIFLQYISPVGAPPRFVAIVRDISERKRAEEDLKFTQFAIDHAGDALFWMGPDASFIRVNDQACRSLGYTREELQSMTVKDVDVDDTDPDRFAEVWQKHWQTVKARRSYTFQTHHRCKDGRIFPVEVMANYVVFKGREYSFAVVRDISERKRAEAAIEESKKMLQLVLDSIPVQVFWKDRNSVYIGCNRQFARDARFEDPGQVVGKTDFDMWWRDYAQQSIESDQEVLETGCIKLAYEKERITPEGYVIWLSTSKVPLTDIDGNIIGVLGVYENITQRKNADAERQVLQQQLQHAQKMEAIGQLTGGIAHDFNNILASIMGFTGLAIDKYANQVDDKLDLYLNEVYRAGERARDLIAQMLKFSRSDVGEAKVLSLAPLVGETIKMLQATLPSTIELQLQIEDALPTVKIDPVHVHQLVMNLCINARDAIQERGRIDIALRSQYFNGDVCDSCSQTVEGDYVELTVRDSGNGFDKEVLKHIFEPFFSTKEVGKGTGLGLSVVHGVMHENGGHIMVESKPGEGTIFHLLFPMVTEMGQTDQENKTYLPAPGSQACKGNVLVVDDDESVGLFIGELLQRRGFEVSVLSDSREALALFNTNVKTNAGKFDLVITDQTMPSMTGEELAREILASLPDMPVILMTGYSDSMNEQQVRALGIRGFLQKPLESDVLIELIRKLLPN